MHHPFDSFKSVEAFVDAAVDDPRVIAIKMTLYRIGSNSPVVDRLIKAVDRGKQVAVLVELKARFDERSNIGWASRLEKAGVHVVYGLVGLKTHSKVALVVRREDDGLQTYTHIATGNYNPTTSRLYTDLGLLTNDSVIGDDATDLFNFLTGFSIQKEFSRLQALGIKGVKIDFFGGDGRSMIQYYVDILNDAAKYNLLVNFHGATLPRGWQKTYPHLMTAEAIYGMEMVTFDQNAADKQANHCAMLPFTRNAFDGQLFGINPSKM